MNAIETEELCKRFGSCSAVDHLALNVPEGSVYGFIGPNGAGKSTTMKMLLGLTHPSSGSVRLLGKSMTDQNRLELLRQTGSLIENPSCYGHLTGEENMRIVADLKGVKKSEIGHVLEVVHLEKARHRKVSQYSLGMRQRLGIAMALLGDPKLLILDEPTNGLDPAGIQEIRSLIAEMPQRSGATVFISSHLLSELEQIVDQVGIIDRGRLLFQGPLSELQKHSRGDVELQLLDSRKGQTILRQIGINARREHNVLILPALRDELLAQTVRDLASAGAGVVGVRTRTKSLEELFFDLTESGVNAQ